MANTTLKFRFLTGDMNWQKYGGKFISRKLNNGEFNYWLVMDVINWEEATGEKLGGATYNVSLYSVSPSEAGQDHLDSAFRCCGLDGEEQAELRSNPLVQVECLTSYGTHAQIWTSNGSNLRKLMHEAREQATIASSLYGFYMDKTENRIGSTGWEMQRGDINSAIDRIAR